MYGIIILNCKSIKIILMKNYHFLKVLVLLAFFSYSCSQKEKKPILSDILIHNGTIYDGSGDKPYIGSIAKCNNLVAATGHAMLGVSLAPITGKLVTDIIAKKPFDYEMQMLSPDRFN